MTLFQLFAKKPTEEIIIDLLVCFGLESLEDTKIFTKKDLKEINSLEEVNKLDSCFRGILFAL